jgi:four helix bundle protein
MDFAVATYHAIPNASKSEMRGLVDQMRRSAVSIPANIAEGYGRESARSYAQFLKVARGSLNEAETHILLAKRLELIEPAQASGLLATAEAISKMLAGLIKSISHTDEKKRTTRSRPSPPIA